MKFPRWEPVDAAWSAISCAVQALPNDAERARTQRLADALVAVARVAVAYVDLPPERAQVRGELHRDLCRAVDALANEANP